MSLQVLVLCSDDKITRALRRVLSDLEIAVEFCGDADAAVRKLTRRRYEAVVVDCSDEDVAAQVLASVRSAPCNKRSIAVAIIDGQKAVRSAFALGAHFVLYKPISAERARTSFRAARALMKCERRRNTRVAVQIPVALIIDNGAAQRKAISSDLSQGGMSVKLSRRAQDSGPVRIKFALPGTEDSIECTAEMAWQGTGAQAGLRFVNLSPEHRDRLKSWLARHSPEMESEDPPAACKLTDLSSGGCYVEIASPFPVNTRVILTMRLAKFENRAEGVVRVMHPEVGMGLEFTRTTNQQRKHLEKFIHALKENAEAQPELVVEPEGMNDAEPIGSKHRVPDEVEDPLLELFQRNADITAEAFQSELRRQRNPPALKANAAAHD
jgi:CheY-like chemotaxis protein/c-di-GMP-binding flagellar brake protein YcgR